MRKYIYLFELDSVRKTDSEIIKGQNALIDEIIYKGNAVVLTFNQIVESRGFYTLLMNKSYKESLLKLFKMGLIKINRYGDTRTISQYLINTIDNSTNFIYSGLPLKSSQRRLMALFKRSIIYSDLSEIDYYLELISKIKKGDDEQDDIEACKHKIKELFYDADNVDEKNNVLLQNNNFESERDKLKTLKSMLQLIFELSLYDDIYLDPLAKEEQKDQFNMVDYINVVISYITNNAKDETSTSVPDEMVSGAKIIKSLNSYKNRTINRSDYKMEIMDKCKINCNTESSVAYHYALGIIDLCYNFVCENSIANISKHYDFNDFAMLKDLNKDENADLSIELADNSFICDFNNRLESYIKDTENIDLYSYLVPNFSALDKKDIRRISQKIKLAASLDKKVYVNHNLDNKVYSYEYKENEQKIKQTRNSIIGIVLDLLLIYVFYKISYAVATSLNFKISRFDFLSNPFFASTAGLFLVDFIKKIFSKIISKYIPIDAKFSKSLVDTVINLIKRFYDLLLFIVYGIKKQIYSNSKNTKNKESEALRRTEYIEYIIPKELKEYKKWYKEEQKNKSCLVKNDSAFYEIADTNNFELISEIIKAEEIKGIKYGVIYSSDYRYLIVDPVRNRNNNGLFPYERIIPKNENGVVIMVKHNDKFVLLKQFRHPIRTRQLCFPRGFCESDSLEDDVLRELKEELEICKNDITQIEKIGTITPDSGLTSGKAHIFYCHVTNFRNSKTEGIEDVIELSGEELDKHIKNNTIIDGFTICAYCLAKEKSLI